METKRRMSITTKVMVILILFALILGISMCTFSFFSIREDHIEFFSQKRNSKLLFWLKA